jgi:acetyltransferase
MLDVGWGDVIYYLGDDPHTQEHRHLHGDDRRRARLPVGGARGGADQADHRHQAGRSEQAAKAAASHTGSLTGSDEVLAPPSGASGVLRVDRISDLFYMAEVLAKQPRPRGPNG